MLEWHEITIRLILAVLYGGLVGFERERKDWDVGIRTHMLAAMGSALVMMVSSFGFSDILKNPSVMLDPSRVASSVIIGIGYLGAGIILVRRPGNIKGLTTASALWVTAGIGLACGGGLYITAGVATFLVLAILYGVQVLKRKMLFNRSRHCCRITVKNEGLANEVIGKMSHMPLKFLGITVKKKKNSCVIDTVVVNRKKDNFDFLKALQDLPHVKKVSCD